MEPSSEEYLSTRTVKLIRRKKAKRKKTTKPRAKKQPGMYDAPWSCSCPQCSEGVTIAVPRGLGGTYSMHFKTSNIQAPSQSAGAVPEEQGS